MKNILDRFVDYCAGAPENPQPDVIVVVRGGLVVGVYSTIEGLVVHVNDHDNDEDIVDIGCNYTAVY